MTVEANSRPPIHQRNDGIGFRAVGMGEDWGGQELSVTCDFSFSADCKAGLSSEAEFVSR